MRLRELHHDLDRGPAARLHLGCAYVESGLLHDRHHRHPTWTHGRLTDRVLSGMTRAELVGCGYAIFGRVPSDLLPPVGPQELRGAVRSELTGYWAWAVRRPWLFLCR